MDAAGTLDPGTRRAAEQVLAADPARIAAALHGTVVATEALLGVGVGAAPGAASGPVVTSLDDALDAADRGEAPVLVLEETGPADEPAMRVAAAVVTTRGGLASHAAVVARAWGLPAVCGLASARVEPDAVYFDGVRVATGAWVAVDGATGEVRSGAAEHTAAPGLDDDLVELLGSCDRLVGDAPRVWVNADAAGEVATGLELGAVGVGLCRTEHQFLGERLGALQTLLLGGPGAAAAAAELAGSQRLDLLGILRAAEGVPVVVRLLDPPLHEFLPAPDDDRAPEELRSLAADWREHNPMLGVRGVRLGVAAPAVLRAQLDGLLSAVADARRAGTPCDLRLLVPMVTWVAEFDRVLDLVRTVAAERSVPAPPVGVMVETPAAALRAAQLGERAAFASVGSNDLTQLVLGLSRDDAEVRVVEAYRAEGLLGPSPFETLDGAVVDLIGSAVASAPGVTWGLCGEHAGDPVSLRLVAHLPLGYVSCSPFRVPVARLELGRIAAARLLGAPAGPVVDGGPG